MGALRWDPDLQHLLDGVAASLARPLNRTGGWALVAWGGPAERGRVRVQGLDGAWAPALEGRAGSWLAGRVRRGGTPLRFSVDEVGSHAGELAVLLERGGSRGLAAFPLTGEGGVSACVAVPLEVEAGLGRAVAAWRTRHRLVAGLQAAAGAAALRVVLEEDRRRPLAPCDGILVVDPHERILFADGLALELPGWTSPLVLGGTLSSLPGGSVIAGVPAGQRGGSLPWERALPAPDGEILLGVTTLPARLGEAGVEGGRVILLQAQGRGEGGVDRTTRILATGLRVADAADAFLRWTATLGAGDERAMPLLDALQGEARSAFELVRRVVDGTADDGARRAVQLNDCLRQVVGHLREQAEAEGVRIFSFLRQDLPAVPGDTVALLRALHTMVRRARRSLGSAGGTLTVRTWTEERWVFASVSDDGGGPGRTSHEWPPDRGDGDDADALQEVRSLAERSGGRLDVEVRPGVWNRTTLMLPVERRSRAALRPAPSGGASSSLDVLVVDDNEALRSVLRRFLERRGHTVTEAVDGEDALGIVAARRFDRAIVDVHMPRRDGPSFYASLATVAPELRENTFFTTGGAMEESVERFLEESGRPALTKPFDFQELARRLEGAA